MTNFWRYLRAGLDRPMSPDRLGQPEGKGWQERIGNLAPFFRRHWRRGLFGALLVLLSGVLALPVPLITRFLVDRVILGRQLSLLASVIILLVLIKGVGMILNAWQPFYFTRFEQRVVLDIQQELIGRMLRFPKSFFDEKETGYVMSRLMGDVQGLRWFFSATLPHAAASMLKLVGGVVLLFYLNWKLAIVVVAVLPFMTMVVRFFSRKLRHLSHHSMEQQAEVSRVVEESISNSTLVKSFATEEKQSGRILERLRSLFHIGLEQVSVSSVAGLTIGIIPDFAQLIVLAAGAYWIVHGQWSLGSLLAFQASMGYVFGPAHFLAESNLQLQHAMASLERFSAIFAIVPEENLGKGFPVHQLKGKVEFRDVSFAYDKREPILEKVSFTVQPGERVAVVGPSGVGKTTLLSLLMQFYRPTSGNIWFDDRLAGEYELASLRRRIGYVSQNIQLIQGSILENILYGDETADEEAARAAAAAAGIHEFIAGLPKGYLAKVGEDGVNFSAGQRQRLAIARVLVKNPDILVLDEPTAALDSVTEKSFLHNLPAQIAGKTLFLVAHRPTTIQQAERILLFVQGRLLADGTHEALLRDQPQYRGLMSETGE